MELEMMSGKALWDQEGGWGKVVVILAMSA